ncbi:methionine gamma-lyase family protein [Anaeropeptidivorans aminofermentans]|uniref:methionine gamma-lyase family protein n=1 Tax=Anaeropeptidivorans aminofermentans TaxID=2934315 RepID=UPI002024E0F3|nr:methionine gamma-lyase family protein [Anaeropeptidivorans aminofermentans]
MTSTERYLIDKFAIDERLLRIAREIEDSLSEIYKKIDERAEYNQLKVLHAMQKNRLSDIHFSSSTGYGYNDIGRDTLEAIYSDVFNTEDSLVRSQIISGTHALTLALFGNLKSGDELISICGAPYDTLRTVIGINKTRGSLIDNGIIYKEVPLNQGGHPDYTEIQKIVSKKTKLVTIQRSRGYSLRNSLSVKEVGELIKLIKNINNNIICLVDNCYGEFVDIIEPSDLGADMIAGSLIKNPGGGISPVGGYICGKREYVENASFRLSAPGIGKEAGPSLGITSRLLQGLFLSPTVVSASLKNAVFAAAFTERLGFKAYPSYDAERSDIVQAVVMDNPENLISFCKGIQSAAPVDSYVSPEPWAMPGYDCDIIMAAGAFIQGSSIELSADGPLRPPYAAFFQGGLTYQHGKNGIIIALNNMLRDHLIKL